MNDFKIESELLTAIKAARLAGLFLQENKKDINKVLSSTKKDIKLKADIEAENIIKEVITNESEIAILSEESGLSVKTLPEVFWVIDPLDGTANYSRDIPLCCVSIALMHKMNSVSLPITTLTWSTPPAKLN